MQETSTLNRLTGLWLTDDRKRLAGTQNGVRYTLELNPESANANQPKFRLYSQDLNTPDREKVFLAGLWPSRYGHGGTKNGIRYLLFSNSPKKTDRHPDYTLCTSDAEGNANRPDSLPDILEALESDLIQNEPLLAPEYGFDDDDSDFDYSAWELNEDGSLTPRTD